MRELDAVLAAYHEATRCSVSVWAAAEASVTLLSAAGEDAGLPEKRPEESEGSVPTHGGTAITTRIPGTRRAWLTVGPCASDSGSLGQHSAILGPVVTQILKGASEAERAAEELGERYEEISLLYTISETLGRTVSVEDAAGPILKELAQIVSARRGAILVHDRDANVLVPVASIGADHSLLPAVSVSDLGSLSAQVFRSRHATTSDGEALTSDAEAPYVRGTTLSVPILWTRSGGTHPLGVVTLSDRETGTPFSAGNQKLVTAVATQIGTAIQNARLMRDSVEQQRLRQEMSLAHDLQMKLLPSTANVAPAAQLAARVNPAESVGGDFYNLFRLGNAATGIMIGDVSSHGYRAALIMALTMSASAIQAQIHSDPAAMLGALLGSLGEELATTEMHISVFYGVVNRKKGALTYANAGHPHAFVFDGDAKPERLPALDPPLGLGSEVPHPASRPWSKDSLLVLFTDGISDAKSPKGDRWGEQKVLDIVKRNRKEGADVIVEKVFDSVRRFTGGASQPDDQTLVVLSA